MEVLAMRHSLRVLALCCGCEAELGRAAGRAERCSRSRSLGALAVGMQALRESFPQRTGSLQRLPLFWDELN
jgi:hypothetical protein